MANTKITSKVIADDAILTANITDANVTTAKIAADAITGAKIADDVALGGNPTTTTQSAGNNTTRVATTAFVSTAVSNLVDSSPSALNTLNELAAALGDDANFSTTVTNSIAAKLPLAGGTMTGDLILGDNVKVEIGSASGGDLQLYHDGTHSYIDNNKGALFIRNNVDDDDNNNIILQAKSGEFSIICDDDGAVTLYYDNAAKLATTSTGIDVTGNVDISVGQLDLDTNYRVRWNGSNDYSIHSDAANYIRFITAGEERLRISSAGTFGMGAGSGSLAGSIIINNDGNTGTIDNAYYNTVLGWEAADDLTSGDSNTIVGNQAGYKLTSGGLNTFIGRMAGETVSTGGGNIAIGYDSLGGSAEKTANYNVAIGHEAGFGVTSGGENIMIGRDSGHDITTGNQNVAIGHECLTKASSQTGNVAVGFQAGELCESNANVFIGYQAGETITSGLGNICIGSGSKTYAASSNYSYVIGYNCQGVYTNDDDSQIVIGSSTGSDRIYNEFNSNASWTRVSDERYKEEITANTDCGLAFINDLKPITYKWKAKADVPDTFPDYDKDATTRRTDKKFYGMIAQDVKTALDKHSITDFGGWNEIEHGIQTVSQEMFVHPLIKAVQELSAKLEAAEARIKTLEDA